MATAFDVLLLPFPQIPMMLFTREPHRLQPGRSALSSIASKNFVALMTVRCKNRTAPMKEFVAASIGALTSSLALANSPCEQARVLKVRSVELSEAGRVPSAPHATAVFYVSLECGGKTFVAQIPGGTPGFDPGALGRLVTVHGWAEQGKSLRIRIDGLETNATLAPAGNR